MSAQSWLNRVWYDDPEPPWWLKAPAALFAAAVRLRRALYAGGYRRRVALSVPVIVVGNLSVGGTGKTPLVCWLAERLRAQGLKPGVVLRGYGGSRQGPHLLTPHDTALEVGDEAILIARRTALPVAVGRERAAAARLLIAAGCDRVIADDGLQHYALQRDCEIAVIDGMRRLGNGFMLPAGPLREPKERLRNVDAVVLNGGESGVASSGVPTLHMRLCGSEAEALRGGKKRTLSAFAGATVHAIAGIGNPQRFFDMLSAAGMKVIAHPKPDHARLGAPDITFADELPVLMTEKDAVKCASFAEARHWCVPVGAAFAPEEERTLLSIVEKAAARGEVS